jgi:hypothetical protein
MFSIFYHLYFYLSKNIKNQNLKRKLIIRFSNIILPLWFKLNPIKGKLDNIDLNNQLVVSLTTFPVRINNVWLVIESLLSQTRKPDKILLWLYKGEFSGENCIPKSLRNLKNRGLEIRFCEENLMPHKKYFYTMQEFPDSTIITVDDDMIYPPNLIEKLLLANSKYSKEIICSITRRINVQNGKIGPYLTWEYEFSNSLPSKKILIMGGGGTLFPPKSLHKDLFNIEVLKEKALQADDLWLKVMSTKAGTKVVSIAGEFPTFPIPIITKRDIKLMYSNIKEGKNDDIFKDLMKYFYLNATDFED